MTLTFDELRAANVKRCNTAFPHKLIDWSLQDWSNAMAGEAGETCNVTKKIRRGDFAMSEAKLIDLTPEGPKLLALAEDVDIESYVRTVGDPVQSILAEEIADVVCYADLLAARAGIDLGEAVRRKFNKVSEKRKSEVKL
jgi:NTP pyrophosphatase (non-canonical NTP hydrolase)